MSLMEMLTIFAIFSGPIVAVQVQRYIEKKRESKKRKEDIFKILMATRGNPIAYAHVEALNRIDLEFYDKKYKKVIDAWKELFDNFCAKKLIEDSNLLWS